MEVEDDSEEGESASEDDSESESESEDETDFKKSKQKFADTDSTTSSESDSDESDSSEESDSESTTSSSSSSSIYDSTPTTSIPLPIGPPIPPGQGTERTHLRNQRKVRVKKLKRLIEEGILPQGSNFAALAAYENQPEHDLYTYIPESPPVNAEEEPPEAKIEQKSPPRRINVAAVSRFIKAGLVGNEGYDRAREEARAKGKTKDVPSETKEDVLEIQAFVPRNVVKKQRTTHLSVTEMPKEREDPVSKETDNADPLIAGFYNQVELAAHHRQSVNNSSDVNGIKMEPKSVVVRAFECEPELCGMVEVQEGEEVDSIEIDPPTLPFVDNYTPRKRSKLKAKRIAVPENGPADDPQTLEFILTMPKLETPSEQQQIYFKSMFLHPIKFQPVVLWRWGKITMVDGEVVTVRIEGPVFKNDDEDDDKEEGEIQQDIEDTLLWSDLMDVRYQIAD